MRTDSSCSSDSTDSGDSVSPVNGNGAAPRSAGTDTLIRRKRSTIYDLARIAGVSPGTVSRVLNNRDKVKAETRDRVLRAAKTLSLRPQVSVRARQIAILSDPTFTDRIEGYAATLTAHLSFACSRRNIGVLLPSQPMEQLPGFFLDGVIAVTFDKALQTVLHDLATRIPVIYMDKFDLSPTEYAVCSDHVNAGYLAAKHLIARGKRKLAYLGRNVRPHLERLRGFRLAMKEAEAVLKPGDAVQLMLAGDLNRSSAITQVVRAGADAIYAPGSSFQAMECLHVLTYVMGLKVPQQVALIGGENEGVSVLQNPPLTTVAEPLKDMAEAAVEMMDRLASGEVVELRQLTLPVRLIERDSVN